MFEIGGGSFHSSVVPVPDSVNIDLKTNENRNYSPYKSPRKNNSVERRKQ